MGLKVDVRYVVDKESLKALKTDPNVTEYIKRAAEQFATDVKARAPRDTGAGADSIRAHDSRAQGATDVGWDAAHWYLFFPEYGTVHQTEKRFVRDLLYDDFEY